MNDMVKNDIISYLDDHIDEEIDRNELGKIVQQAIIKMLRQIRSQNEIEKEP